MRILFIGDILGRSGRAVVLERLPGLIRDWKLDFVVVNAENAAGGFGITETIYKDIIGVGADAINPKYSEAVFRSFPPAPNTWGLNILPLGQFRPAPRLSVSPLHIA